jgi:hypothetical protein
MMLVIELAMTCPEAANEPSKTTVWVDLPSTVLDIKKAPWRKNCPVFQQFLAVVYSVVFYV